MSLRIKILILLGAIALVPAAITALLDVQRLRSLGADITQRNADALAAQAVTTMQRIAAEYAAVLDRETRRIRLLVTLQADYAERLLRAPTPPAHSPSEISFSESFDDDAAKLSLTTDPAPLTYGDSGDGAPLPVSWNHQVFHHAPTVNRDDVIPSAPLLLPMMAFYKNVRDPHDSVLRSQYVALENGLLATYPGHGNYPPEFDARERPWYIAQLNNPKLSWQRPHVDAATGAVVINATMPLHASDGEFIGVAGIDVDITSTFAAMGLPDYLRDGAELWQVAVLRPPRVLEPEVVVFARQRADADDYNWRAQPELETLVLGNRATMKQLRAALLANENGHLRAMVDGRDTFISYHRFGRESAYLIMTVPVATATRAAMDAGRYAEYATASHVTTLLKFLFAASTLVLIVALVASRHITRPIDHLKTAVERLARGDFLARAQLSTGDELQTLGDAFDAMVPQLKEHARVGEALGLAREIQQNLLPACPPSFNGYDIGGSSVYSEQTGGDYFDYVPLPDSAGKRLAVVVADVAGHGIGPALIMATTRALLHGGAGREVPLGELVGYVNTQLAPDVNRGHFVTLFLLAIDDRSGQVAWVAAGHDPALHFNASDHSISDLSGHDIPLGIDADWQFTALTGLTLNHNDIVVIGTDGIWEAAAENGERFGKQRLRDYITVNHQADAQTLCDGLKLALETFRGTRAQHDDVTIMIVKRTAP